MTDTSEAAVERFTPEWSQNFASRVHAYMVAEPEGRYVLYSDYAALRSELTAANQRVEAALASVAKANERAEDQAALVHCACAYDKPTDLCDVHKRIVDAAVAKARDAALVEAGAELQHVADNCEMRGGSHADMRGYERSARVVLALRTQPPASVEPVTVQEANTALADMIGGK